MTKKQLVGLTSLYNEIQSELPGLSIEHSKRVIHAATNVFLERSNVWRHVITPIVNADGIATLFPPLCTTLVSYRNPEWKGAPSKKPRSFNATTPYELTLVPAPIDAVIGDFEVTLILKMDENSDKIPDYILEVHREALRIGALARLMLEPNKPYTNGDVGLMYNRQTTVKISEARNIAERMYGRNESHWTYPVWA